MKYEYLKGSEKDFEGAPEWCTHVSKTEDDEGQIAWEESNETKKGNMYQWNERGSIAKNYNSGGSLLNIIAERRPITEPEWDGVGLPPVGCECEFTFGPYDPDEFDDIGLKTLAPGTVVNVVSHKVTGDGNHVAVIYWDEDGGGRASCIVGSCLKPICSEADKKRDDIAKAINAMVDASGTLGHVIYDAIAAGKIPCVKLED